VHPARAQGGTCVIVGDDEQLAAEIGEQAERLIGCRAWRPTAYKLPGGHNQSTFTHSSYEVKCAATAEMFVDEEIMANSDYLVRAPPRGTAKSRLA
jgi:hypothetical protein